MTDTERAVIAETALAELQDAVVDYLKATAHGCASIEAVYKTTQAYKHLKSLLPQKG